MRMEFDMPMLAEIKDDGIRANLLLSHLIRSGDRIVGPKDFAHLIESEDVIEATLEHSVKEQLLTRKPDGNYQVDHAKLRRLRDAMAVNLVRSMYFKALSNSIEGILGMIDGPIFAKFGDHLVQFSAVTIEENVGELRCAIDPKRLYDVLPAIDEADEKCPVLVVAEVDANTETVKPNVRDVTGWLLDDFVADTLMGPVIH